MRDTGVTIKLLSLDSVGDKKGEERRRGGVEEKGRGGEEERRRGREEERRRGRDEERTHGNV